MLYASHDVTGLLRAGRNAVGVMLGNGWYAAEADVPPSPSHRKPYGDRPRLLLQLEVELTEGEPVRLASGTGWKASAGPVRYNDYSHGESYDARRELPGWDTPGYDDSRWSAVQEVAAPSGTLRAQPLAACEVVETRAAKRILTPAAGVSVYDFGQNCSGWSRLRVRGERGSRVTLKHGARVYADGSLDARSNLYDLHCTHVARQRDSYTLKGRGVEEWEPRFTLHGFRYVEVSGYPGTPRAEHLQGRVVRNAAERVGSFRCSNELLNRIHEAAVWTFASSLQGFPQDAADRSERVGWLGDPIPEDYMYNFDTARFWSKWCDDLADSQKPDGQLPVISPLHWRGSSYDPYGNCPVWWSHYALIPWSVYWFYDDERVLAEHAAGIGKLVDYLSSRAQEHIVEFGLGDHMEPQPDGTTSSSPRHTPPALTSTAYYHFDARVAARAAEIAGRGEEARRYGALAEEIKVAFNRRFLDRGSNQYATGSQTCQRGAAGAGAGAGAAGGRGAGQPDPRHRGAPRRAPVHGDAGDQRAGERAVAPRRGGGNVPHRDADHVSELGVHDRARGDHPVGVVERPAGREAEPEHEAARQRGEVLLPRPGGDPGDGSGVPGGGDRAAGGGRPGMGAGAGAHGAG